MVIAPATEAQVAQVPMLRAGSRSGLHYVYILLSNIDNEVVLRAAQAQDVVRRVPGLVEAEVKRLKGFEAVSREAQSAAPRVRAASVGADMRAKRMGMCKARASAGGMWGAQLRAREPRGSGLLEVVFMLASTLPRIPAARKPLNPSGIHPKRAGTAWDASRPWCGGLRPLPRPAADQP